MARVLIVGDGERAGALGRALEDEGWAVSALAGIESERVPLARLIDAIEGVSVIAWLLASEDVSDETSLRLNGEVLGRLLEEIVDSPVRGVAYEAWGSGAAAHEPAQRAEATWRIRTAAIDADPGDESWVDAARGAVTLALAG